MNIKNEILNILKNNIAIDEETILNNITEIKEKNKGDYTFPCFVLSKILKKSPNQISDELKNSIKTNEIIEKIESVNGYLNFYINKELLIKEVFNEFDKLKDKYGSSNIGEGKTILIDYSSPNIAKPFHIGHMRSTIIGGALYNLYKFLGYNVVGINHLGDYGTQFGKLIEGYKLWHDEYNIEENPIDELTKIYVRINNLCEEDEEVLERCRNNFKLLEEKDPYCVELWNKFKELSLKEFNRTYDLLGSKFDSLNGEAFYIDKMPEVIQILEKNNKLTESEGARVVDLTDAGIDTPCIIQKSNGSSIYATRDLAAILYRARTYDYYKNIYVTGSDQILHFKQVFEVAKYLDLDEKYINGLEHVPFGMVRLPEGKLSTRKGNIVKLEDLLNDSINHAKEIIKEKREELENIDEVAQKVGIGAVIFNDLYNSRIKDEVFDLKEMLNFQGETCPYIQYMYVRINSIIEKYDKKVLINEIDYSKLNDELTYNIVKLLYNFTDTIILSTKKSEPYILSRYLIDLARAYSSFYSNNKVLSDDIDERNARIYLINIVGNVLKVGMNLLGIQMPNKM
ncbi:MAG: arginine--tRNA ligase [Bacilli bacterium]|nr:arginine--tRNA ligase [Bacilli bacterium]